MPPPAPVSSWARMLNSIRQNGFLGFHRQMLRCAPVLHQAFLDRRLTEIRRRNAPRMNDAKVGRLVGTDYIGNKYYEK